MEFIFFERLAEEFPGTKATQVGRLCGWSWFHSLAA